MAENFRRAAALRERLSAQMRGNQDDGWGQPVPGAGPFEEQFEISAGLRPLRGSEAVLAARLEGRQPYVLTVRNTSQTRQITTSWQFVDKRNPKRVFAVTSPFADPDGRNAWLEGLVVEGGLS
ncbi:MAG: head-tail adaptor protein [Candidatus Devosia phytovorans]|uniref:Head-tail adaptor protein n=1 Tax=Candidatus Devosia phytovorans TaxID=3121372 RepID=A0AAJ6B0I1_9HYPH|nr:head-tail adaptor protein [Devosia sp.]WEK05765.1 MAG: head-tail adaptor protein [Devosia sp.]